MFRQISFDRGKVTKHRIVRVKQVHIKGSLPDMYQAALVDTNLGHKIVLFKYVSERIGWWSRVYDAEVEKN